MELQKVRVKRELSETFMTKWIINTLRKRILRKKSITTSTMIMIITPIINVVHMTTSKKLRSLSNKPIITPMKIARKVANSANHSTGLLSIIPLKWIMPVTQSRSSTPTRKRASGTQSFSNWVSTNLSDAGNMPSLTCMRVTGSR